MSTTTITPAAAPSAGAIRVPYLDLSVDDPEFRERLLAAVGRVLDHGRFIMGPEHDEFEARIAAYCGRRHCVGVGSGTDAVYLALRALDIGPGDEVITTPMTWVATTNAVVLCGATPVFADIGEDLNIDAGRIEAAITRRTKAILPVHFTGQMCDMDAIMEIADRHGIALVEDAAQAFGARDHDRPAGSFGRVACFSMNPMKVFNAFGEAGAVVTDDDAIAERLRSLRYAGTINKEDCHEPSINGRLDTIHAAMMLVNLDYLDGKIAHRRLVADKYRDALAGVVDCAREKDGFFHSYYCFTLFAARRDALRKHLLSKGIETKIQHPLLMPQHTAYRERFKADVPVAERMVRRIICVPAHEDVSDDDIAFVSGAVREFYDG